jgi:hypothetical protein
MDSMQEHIAKSAIDADKVFLGSLCWQMMGPGKWQGKSLHYHVE